MDKQLDTLKKIVYLQEITDSQKTSSSNAE